MCVCVCLCVCVCVCAAEEEAEPGKEEEPRLEEVLGVSGGGGGGGDRSFSSLAGLVSEKTLRAIEEMQFKEMMEIQYRSIRPLLEGK